MEIYRTERIYFMKQWIRKMYESYQRYYVILAAVDRNKVEKTQSDDAAASTLIKIME